MKPSLLLTALSMTLLIGSDARSAPIPSDAKNRIGPALMVQVKSANELRGRLHDVKEFFPSIMQAEFEKNLISLLDEKSLPGLDFTRPAGLYVILGPGLMLADYSKTSVVAMVPITNEKEFLELLGRTHLPIEKKGDIHVFGIPESPVPVCIRFQRGWAFIGFSGDNLDPKLLLDPLDVINDKEKAALAARLRIDRIPEELKQVAISFIEQKLAEEKNMKPPQGGAVWSDYFLDMTLRWLRAGAQDGKELTIRYDFDGKRGVFASETILDPKPESSLAKSVGRIEPTTNDFAQIIGDDSAASAMVQIPLFAADLKGLFSTLIADGRKSAEKSLRNDETVETRQMVSEIFAALERTVAGGKLDLAASLRGPDAKGQYTAVGGVSLKDGAPLEQSIRKGVAKAPKSVGEQVKFDAFKVGDVNVHEIMVGDELNPDAEKIFSKSSVYVAFAPSAAFVTFGSHAKDAIRDLLTAKLTPKTAPVVSLQISGSKLAMLIKGIGVPDEGPGKEFFDKFIKLDRSTIWEIKVEGGERLLVRQEIGVVPMISVFGGVLLFRQFGANAAPPQALPAPAPVPPIKAEKKVITIEKKVPAKSQPKDK